MERQFADIRMIHGDCLEVMPGIADGSVDMVLADLPYGCLNRGNEHASWDCDLDPCAPSREFYTARKCYTKDDDGLSQPWDGRVWCNPPYSRKLIVSFLTRMAEHGNGIALVFNRMDTGLWHDVVFPSADAMLVMRGRVRFVRPDGSEGDSAGCGSVLVAWGVNAKVLRDCGIDGRYFDLK